MTSTARSRRPVRIDHVLGREFGSRINGRAEKLGWLQVPGKRGAGERLWNRYRLIPWERRWERRP
jgi:hypothetical protein